MSWDDWDYNENGIDDFVEFMIINNAIEEEEEERERARALEEEEEEEEDEYDSYDSRSYYGGGYTSPYTSGYSKYSGMSLEEVKAEVEKRERQNEEIRRSNRRFLIVASIGIVLFCIFLIAWGLEVIPGIIFMVWIFIFLPKYWS